MKKTAAQRRQYNSPTCPFCRRQGMSVATGQPEPIRDNRQERPWVCAYCNCAFTVVSNEKRTIRKTITRKGSR